jgi:dTDP-4-dehydrorhamnose reductase
VKILLLGNTGQLGWELQRTLQPLGEVIALDYPEVDMANADSIRKTLREHRPSVIVNATAYTAVDRAESEPEPAEAINATGPGILADEAKALNAFLIHYSTDYVFDGKKGSPYSESDAPNPLNVYGRTKLAGEQAVRSADGAYLIFRTAWVYSLRRDNFVTKVLHWAREKETLRIVDDQISNPTWARMLAETTSQILCRGTGDLTEHKGLYHLAGGGYTSRLEWAKEIIALDPKKAEQKVRRIVSVKTTDFPTPAVRPLFSALDCSGFGQIFNRNMPSWRLSMRLAIPPSVSE